MNAAFRLTQRDLDELECIDLYGNIAYEVASPIWTRLKQMEQAELLTSVSNQPIIGYQATECFEITDKGRRILRGSYDR